MSVTTADIEKVAKLARIRIDADDLPELTARLGNILAMVDKLQAVDTTGIEPMSNPFDASQRLRADVVTEPDQRDALLAIAPKTEQGLFLVPKVIE
jgi:aspartyl-tRNA(Asn)/glutamyl-tRNA(Gln) amidotransferase subunit C